jgi:hypothetical protein
MLIGEELISREKMASIGGLSQDEKDILKTLIAMSKMVKVLYEDYLERKRTIQEKSSKNNKGKGGLKEVSSTSISENISKVCTEGKSSNYPYFH